MNGDFDVFRINTIPLLNCVFLYGVLLPKFADMLGSNYATEISLSYLAATTDFARSMQTSNKDTIQNTKMK